MSLGNALGPQTSALERFGPPSSDLWSALGFRKRELGRFGPPSGDFWRLWVFEMEHWRGVGPSSWSLGAPWASNLGSLGSFEVSKLGASIGLQLQVGVSKPAFAEDMVLQTGI